ncbi:hypothetical protein EPUL_003973 [Erysiphe pulchra]|uniref:Uncharacterized protein n=1 Tax=Erysiphe pulchra TaxID=225359 RepID=A0A2S4PVR4_9PEZI|nr:hypothetical protein EPUL_003973 [Erysiphe pulchra]
MQYLSIILFAAFAIANVLSKRVIDQEISAKPNIGITDGTPRDCETSTGCSSEADTSIINRNRELGTNKASALDRTQEGSPIDASKMVATEAARDLSAANLMRRSRAVRAANGEAKNSKRSIETRIKIGAKSNTHKHST